MKQEKFFLHFGCTALATTMLMSSCVVGNVPADPYIVNQSRQEENIYYVPSAPNTPLLFKKNDFGFNLMRTSGEKFEGAEIQAAFLPTNHLGLIGSYSFSENRDDGVEYMNYNRIELGAGYMQQLSKGFHFETYAGLGKGKITNRHHTGFSKENLTHLFLQPTIAFSNEKKNVQFGFASKFSGVRFNIADTAFNTDREPFSANELVSLYEKPFHIIWEPAFIFRFGWQNFLFHTGYNFSADITNRDLYRSKGNFSIGISLQFNTSKKEKAAE